MSNFIHLHLHNKYSLQDGLNSSAELVAKAKELGMPALALTNHGYCYGLPGFWRAAKEAGIKPILGAEFYITLDGLKCRNPKDRKLTHITVLAKNKIGYQNLLKLATIAAMEGFFYFPRLDIETLCQYSEGLIILSGCMYGVVSRPLWDKAFKRFDPYDIVSRLCKAATRAKLYIELQDVGVPEQKEIINPYLLKMADKLRLPLVATNDVHYVTKEQGKLHDVVYAVRIGKTLRELAQEGASFTHEMYFKSEAEMRSLGFPAEAYENTLNIAEMVEEYDIGVGEKHWPLWSHKKEGQKEAEQLLRDKANQGLRALGLKSEQNQLDYELDVIISKGFADYFLISQDLIEYAKSQGIMTGPSRGSVGGSLVAYCLGITAINPLEYNLSFERFLNPNRPKPPDVDIDFQHNRRAEILAYVKEKYGKGHVAQIGTFSHLEAKAAIKDVGRVLGFPAKEVQELSNMVMADANLNELLEGAKVRWEDWQAQILHIAAGLQGTLRQESKHAAGVLIADIPIKRRLSLRADRDTKEAVVQADMDDAEALGFLKFDFLGSKTMSVIANTLKKIGLSSYREIPLDDPKVYRLLTQGRTQGVFQFESFGMRNLLREIRPTKVEDLATATALFRPGPLVSGTTDAYKRRRNGLEKVVYLHPSLEPILSDTYGLIVYQEQVIKIASFLAGYSQAEADLFREAIGKKKIYIIQQEKERFINGLQQFSGFSNKEALQLYEQVEAQSGYSFNKAHAVGYALISYYTAWLKSNYPAEFLCERLNEAVKNKDKTEKLLRECAFLHVEVLAPDINRSSVATRVDNFGRLQLGLQTVEGVGEQLARRVVSERGVGLFPSFTEAAKRLIARGVHTNFMLALYKGGAFSVIEPALTEEEAKGILESLSRNLERYLWQQMKIY